MSEQKRAWPDEVNIDIDCVGEAFACDEDGGVRYVPLTRARAAEARADALAVAVDRFCRATREAWIGGGYLPKPQQETLMAAEAALARYRGASPDG